MNFKIFAKRMCSTLEQNTSTLLDLASELPEHDLQDAANVIEGLQLVIGMLQKLNTQRSSKVKDLSVAIQKSALPSFKKIRVPKESRAPRERKYQVPDVAYGTYGSWDYPATLYTLFPALEDLDNLMEQKNLRDPKNTMWQDKQKCIEWFKTKGWI